MLKNRTVLKTILLSGIFILSIFSCPSLLFAHAQSASAGRAIFQRNLIAYSDQPIFRFPVVPDTVISGYFDHETASGLVTFFDGRSSSPGAGFYFSCSDPAMYDWVGCEDAVTGEAACSNNRELWYDGHKGTDYEYSPNWYTGAACDPGRFDGITREVFAPASGQVLVAGTDPNRPANGWHIRLKHDLNGNGNYNDDNFRSVYLHFTANALAVVPGQIVSEGEALGLGGSTGYSSSPHLHFEVQRSSDFFQTNYWSVDPYGWQGPGNDPWPYQNVDLFQHPVVIYTNFVHLPTVLNSPPECQGCTELIQNGGFETGHSIWEEQGVMIIVRSDEPNLTISPFSGEWLAWLGGRNDALDVINQDFNVPSDATRGVLRFELRVNTKEMAGGQDLLSIRLRQADGTVLQEEIFDNAFSPQDQWVQREINLIDLRPFQGQTLRLNVKGTTNSANYADFYLDDLSFVSSGP